ncbi:MAG TPA: beta-eliminating lyase-related protein [Niallia sp.]|nr:beta-eliminating lyase-related protein [Niallia sp.]
MDLKTSYSKTTYKLGNHGKRNVQVLTEAFDKIDGSVDSDMYGNGEVIESFQDKMAKLLGKEEAVFFPSGTMAQQIALRIWCDEKKRKKVAYHPLSHLEIHEEDGLKELHGIETILLADETRVIELQDIMKLDEEIACILLELPQREIGGQLPSYQTLEEISHYCRQKGIKLHLDGARLLEILPFYQKTAAEIGTLFDSVYLSFYKGIGGIAGAILAGDAAFIAKSKVWKRRYGGDLISLYPYILSADYYYEKRANKMADYYKAALELASQFNKCDRVRTLPLVPVSNMFHVHFKGAKETIENSMIEIQNQTGIGISSYLKELDIDTYSFEISLGDAYGEVPKEKIAELFHLLNERMKRLEE